MSSVLEQLANTLEARKQADSAHSYVASLYAKGPDATLKKIGEEAVEVILAGKDGATDAIVHEVADLWFHSLVLLAQHDLHPAHILNELERRFGQSGITEKATRTSNDNAKRF